MIKRIQSIPSIMLYAMPLLFVFTIYLLAYWPGLLVSDALYQWHQVQTSVFDNWHPVFNTLYIWLLTRIINSPTFVIFIQIIIFSFVFAYSLTKLEKYYHIRKKFLFIFSSIFAFIPLNANFSVLLLKDILYSVMILLFSTQLLCIINEKDWLSKKLNLLSFSFVALIITLFRHNGIIVVLFTLICLFVFFKSKKSVVFISIIWLVSYLFLNTIVTSLIHVKENTYANKYGPVAHLYAAMLNETNVKFSNDELEKLSFYVDIDKLKTTYNPYLMDPSINCQNIESLKVKGNEFVKMGLQKAVQYPLVTVKHYLKLTSFLYSPMEFKQSFTAGMFVKSDLWVYKDVYPQLETNSKLPKLLPVIQFAERAYQFSPFRMFTVRPALYIYLSILMIIFLVIKLKNKKIILFVCPAMFNILSLIISIPAPMTRYIYSSILIFWVLLALFISQVFKKYQYSYINEGNNI